MTKPAGQGDDGEAGRHEGQALSPVRETQNDRRGDEDQQPIKGGLEQGS